MENSSIIKALKLTAALMELHETEIEKAKALQAAVFKLDKFSEAILEIPEGKLAKEGINKWVIEKIQEFIGSGSLAELSEMLEKTPKGVVEMLGIKGIGPKKVRTIWTELNITSKKELLEACNENKVQHLKGFGEKTQQEIKNFLVFAEEQKGKFLYAEVEALAYALEKILKETFSESLLALSGEIRRRMEIVETIQFIVGTDNVPEFLDKVNQIAVLEKNEKGSSPFAWRGAEKASGCKVEIKVFTKAAFHPKLFLNSCDPAHLQQTLSGDFSIGQAVRNTDFDSEEAFYQANGLHYIVPEMREGLGEVEKARKEAPFKLVREEDLKGILHNHSTYSDGKHTLQQMAEYCKSLGYAYLGISDHSKSAFYARGLYENRIAEQHLEIDKLNQELAPFKIFKGIESDILNDGSLDYEPEVLASFDFIVASIHSNLKMPEDKATERLLKAIENPFTTILGHATGRLLLMREGYPINHKKIIDACVAHEVIIELNANPRRLDMDWRWIAYALEKGALISINPDAHSMKEYHNMHYGVLVGRKAGLSPENTFNAFPLEKVEAYFQAKKRKN